MTNEKAGQAGFHVSLVVSNALRALRHRLNALGAHRLANENAALFDLHDLKIGAEFAPRRMH